MRMSNHTRIRTALKFAAHKHAGQLRKGTEMPYLVHPVEVGLFLQNIGMTHDTVIAGYLHDTIEDTSATYGEIEEIFGTNIADVVLELTCTDKAKALKKAKTYSPEAVKIKMADLMCNVTDMLDDYSKIGDELFKRFRNGKNTLDHYRKMTEILIEKNNKKNMVVDKQLQMILTKLDLMV